MASNIGIKIANGDFYPLLEENSLVRKRLVLTTVHDNQPSVQIDLFRSSINTMADAQYIGSLVVENIKPRPKGEPSVEMVISSNSDGDIIADAINLETGSGGEHYVLTVSLKSLDESAREMEIPDFELDSGEETPSGLYQNNRKTQRKLPLWVIILAVLILLLGLAAIWLFMMGGKDILLSRLARPAAVQAVQPVEPIRQPEPAPVVTAPAPTPAPEPAPAVTTPAVATPAPAVAAPAPVVAAPAPRPLTPQARPRPPVYSFNVPSTIPRDGVNYTIRWGDTLWDISEVFYRDPHLYTRIAQHNNIRNPNLIISGRTIRIPPRN